MIGLLKVVLISRPWRRGILRPLIDGKIDDASWPAVERPDCVS